MFNYHQLLLACVLGLGATLFGMNCPAQDKGEPRKSPASSPSISLVPCEVPSANGTAKHTVRCGTFEVFEDRSRKSGRKIALKIVVFPATGPDKAADPLFYIPGGPGSSATEDAPYVAQQFAKIREHRDLVFVDQRGTGGSNPLNCDFFKPADLRSYLGEYFPLEDVRKCREQLEPKANLKLYTTPIAMDDLDDVRAALGYNQINIIGGSYGTRAAQVYLKLHQTGFARLSCTVFLQPTSSCRVTFPQHTERALNGVMADCAADDACRAAFPNLPDEVKSVLEWLMRGPVEVELKRQGGKYSH